MQLAILIIAFVAVITASYLLGEYLERRRQKKIKLQDSEMEEAQKQAQLRQMARECAALLEEYADEAPEKINRLEEELIKSVIGQNKPF